MTRFDRFIDSLFNRRKREMPKALLVLWMLGIVLLIIHIITSVMLFSSINPWDLVRSGILLIGLLFVGTLFGKSSS